MPRRLCYRNLMIICLVSGLWHGAAWTFIRWGFLHGIYLVVERAMGRHRFATGSETVPAGEGAFPSAAVLGRILLTYGLVCVAWVFFRAESLGDALLIFGRMLFAFGPASELLAMLSAEAASLLVIVCPQDPPSTFASGGWHPHS